VEEWKVGRLENLPTFHSSSLPTVFISKPGSIKVEEGQSITQGYELVRAGQSGTDAVHLHIELRAGNSECKSNSDYI
jgi:hypothetical protein